MWRALLLLVTASLTLTPQTRKNKAAEPSEGEGMMSRFSGGYKFTNGLVWSPEGYLLFADTPAGKVFKSTVQGTTIFREGLAGPQGIAVDDNQRVYICETRARRVVRIDKKGALHVLADKWEGKRLNGPNDIVAGKNDHVYFTDPAFASAEQARELPFYGIYHVSPKGELSLAGRTAGRPNGIALSPDGRTLYVADSDNRRVLAYDVAKNGPISNERVLIASTNGVPDGVRTDKTGQIYVAAREISIYSPDGKLVRSVPVGEKPSSAALGDGDLGTLYIAARTSVYRIRLEPGEARH